MVQRPDPDRSHPDRHRPAHLEADRVDDGAFARQRTVRVVVGSHLDELVARKTGTNPAAVVAVEREALVLGQLRHPNVIDLVRAERGDGSATIVTQYAGRTTLQQERPNDAADVARIGAALLTVAGELHSMGWVHGRLRPEHCIVGDDGRLTLCALGAAHRVEPRDPRRAAELGDVVQIISGLAERLPAPVDRAARRRLRHLQAALAVAGDHPSPTTAERLRVTLTQQSGSVAIVGNRIDPAVTQPSRRSRARARQEDTTRRTAPPPPGRAWRGALVSAAGLAVLFGIVAFLRWVGGPLGLDGGATAVRRLGDLPPALLVAFNIIRVAAFAACLYGIALFAATLAAIATRRSDVERLATTLAPPRLRQALVGLIGLGVVASVATGPGHAGPGAGPTPTVIDAPIASTTSAAPPSTTTAAPSTTTAAPSTTTTPAGTPAAAPRAVPEPAATALPVDAIEADDSSTAPTGLPNLWVMAPGDHLWGVAAEALAGHQGRPVTSSEVDGYWRRLVDLNRESLIDPDNPDLVFAGQVIELPPFD